MNGVRKKEVYIISFPKCGRTWLRLLLGKIIQMKFSLHESVNLLNVEHMYRYHNGIPRIRVKHDDQPHLKNPESLSDNSETYRNKTVLFLVRDPRGVIISLYFQFAKREKHYKGSLSNFLYEKQGELEIILKYYNIWENDRDVIKEFMLVHYEELHENTLLQLNRIIKFIGINNVSDEMVRNAVNFAHFDNMRKMEKDNIFNSNRLKLGNLKDFESYKTRKGKIGGYKEYLNPTQIEYLNNMINKELSTFYDYYRS